MTADGAVGNIINLRAGNDTVSGCKGSSYFVGNGAATNWLMAPAISGPATTMRLNQGCSYLRGRS
jgi:hypothetical protein